MCIAAGYPDADDLDALRHDPALLIACNRAPEGGCRATIKVRHVVNQGETAPGWTADGRA
jgi:hypothetical protein